MNFEPVENAFKRRKIHVALIHRQKIATDQHVVNAGGKIKPRCPMLVVFEPARDCENRAQKSPAGNPPEHWADHGLQRDGLRGPPRHATDLRSITRVEADEVRRA